MPMPTSAGSGSAQTGTTGGREAEEGATVAKDGASMQRLEKLHEQSSLEQLASEAADHVVKALFAE